MDYGPVIAVLLTVATALIAYVAGAKFVDGHDRALGFVNRWRVRLYRAGRTDRQQDGE